MATKYYCYETVSTLCLHASFCSSKPIEIRPKLKDVPEQNSTKHLADFYELHHLVFQNH